MMGRLSLVACVGSALGLGLSLPPQPVSAQQSTTGTGPSMHHGAQTKPPMMISPGMMMPSMDPTKGRKLFAAKGCVVCHAVNGIGGQDAPALDASTMPGMTNPFDFVANMWRGAAAMIDMQREELGEQIEFTGQELADIIAFLHHEKEQKKFSDADIPPKIKAVMAHMKEPEGMEHMKGMDMNKMQGPTNGGN
jgi:cytochrome c